MKILFSFLLILALCSSLAMARIKCCDVNGKVLFEDAQHSCEGLRKHPTSFCEDFGFTIWDYKTDYWLPEINNKNHIKVK